MSPSKAPSNTPSGQGATDAEVDENNTGDDDKTAGAEPTDAGPEGTGPADAESADSERADAGPDRIGPDDSESAGPGLTRRLLGLVLIVVPLALAALWAVVGPTPQTDDAAGH
ncbi:hypothetical protein G6016_13495, partial [Dietzia aerolata]|nr:hypothetical protein [Dietzia aerolata]